MGSFKYGAHQFQQIQHVTDGQFEQYKKEIEERIAKWEKLMEPFEDKPGTENKVISKEISLNLNAADSSAIGPLQCGPVENTGLWVKDEGIQIIDESTDLICIGPEIQDLKEKIAELNERVHDLEHPNALDVIVKKKLSAI